MTNVQLYLAIGIVQRDPHRRPDRAVAKFEAMNAKVDAKFDLVDARFESMNGKFDAINTRLDAIDKGFDDMRDLWRAELRCVEEVLDARLKHLEARL